MEPTSASDQFMEVLWALGILSMFVVWIAIVLGVIFFGVWLFNRHQDKAMLKAAEEYRNQKD